MALDFQEPIIDVEEISSVPEIHSDVESGIREALRLDRRPLRRVPSATSAAEPGAALLAKMSDAPIEEIDRAIGELQGMRKALQEHGDRVQRELADYASTSRSAFNSLRSLSDNLSQWKSPAA
jgi:hypothetical protein